jgi:murein DD-endopeptidase MepM/ murein hydrolase activator NlpD
MFYKGENTSLEIEAVDNSKWNLLEGNKVIKSIGVKIDTKKPVANVISNSRYIQRGGSAVVVVKVKDDNLKDAYISFNNKERFELTPYYKEDYYCAFIAWPIDIEKFSRVNLVVVDKANNKTISKIPFYVQNKKIQIDNIQLSTKFINNVSKSVLEQSFEAVPKDMKEVFVYSNTILRSRNIDTIKNTAVKSMSDELVEEFTIEPFKRLRGSKTVAKYAERRHYFLDKDKINEAWHLGIDWASVKKASIHSSNKGVVIFKDYLGLYGNTIIIDHGMGVSSLYAHTSSQDVEVGDLVELNQKIANTGATGAVFGDHLHFGILVQGIEVNPLEWMDKKWIQVRITDILNNSKLQIDGK